MMTKRRWIAIRHVLWIVLYCALTLFGMVTALSLAVVAWSVQGSYALGFIVGLWAALMNAYVAEPLVKIALARALGMPSLGRALAHAEFGFLLSHDEDD